MSTTPMTDDTTGLDSLAQRTLIDAILQRRTHRVSRGSDVEAGTMSYTSASVREPLTELEEAVLIAITGCTGLSMPDRPLSDPRNHQPIMAKPNLNMVGRSAGSPDNAQGTHFFLINDSGTYFLRKLPPPEEPTSVFDPAPQRSKFSITASTSPTETATFPPISTPTGSCPTCPAPRCCSQWWTCRGSTSTE